MSATTTTTTAMRPIPTSLSVAGYAYQHVTDWLNQYESQPERVMKQISAEFAYTGIMIFAALETLAHGVHALVLKGLCHYVNDEEAKKKAFIRKYIVPAGESFLFSASVAGGAAINLKDNFDKFSVSKNVTGQIIDGNATLGKVQTFILEKFSSQLKAMGFRV
jgi:hypothetical protein